MRKFVPVLLFALVLFIGAYAHATDINENEKLEEGQGTSGLPLPRFAALRAGDVNLRTGPGTRYPIDWVFVHQGMPVEIIAEFEVWRRVRDADGDEGWVHKNALSGKRTAIVLGEAGSIHELRRKPDVKSDSVAHLEAGVIGQLLACAKDWCKLRFSGIKGYLPKTEFWGTYAGETFD